MSKPIPTDAEIQQAIGTTTHTVEDIKMWAMKALCRYYTSHTVGQILHELKLVDSASPYRFKPTELCKRSVWEWHRKDRF